MSCVTQEIEAIILHWWFATLHVAFNYIYINFHYKQSNCLGIFCIRQIIIIHYSSYNLLKFKIYLHNMTLTIILQSQHSLSSTFTVGCNTVLTFMLCKHIIIKWHDEYILLETDRKINCISIYIQQKNSNLCFYIWVLTLTFFLLEPRIISLCHQYKSSIIEPVRPTCTLEQSADCWLTNFKFLSWLSLNMTMEIEQWIIPINKVSSLRVINKITKINYNQLTSSLRNSDELVLFQIWNIVNHHHNTPTLFNSQIKYGLPATQEFNNCKKIW